MSASSPTNRVVAVIAIAAVLLVGFGIMSPLADLSDGFNDTVIRDDVLLDGAGTFVSVNDHRGVDETVYKTTGFAVNLSGANDSKVESTTGVDIGEDNNWTISMWGYVDQDAANANQTALSINGRLLISYDGQAGNWSAWYYAEGSRNSYQVNVSDSGDQPGNFTNIIVQANDSELQIYRNNTLGDTANLSQSSLVDAPINSTNWDGRLEEIRGVTDVLNQSERASFINNPVEGQPDFNRSMRIMFDQPNRDRQLILFDSADLTQSNVSYSSGFTEQVMSEDTLLVSGDYEWKSDGPELKPTSGGSLASAPVAYVSYTAQTGLDGLVETVGTALLIGGVVVIVLTSALAIRAVRDL